MDNETQLQSHGPTGSQDVSELILNICLFLKMLMALQLLIYVTPCPVRAFRSADQQLLEVLRLKFKPRDDPSFDGGSPKPFSLWLINDLFLFKSKLKPHLCRAALAHCVNTNVVTMFLF